MYSDVLHSINKLRIHLRERIWFCRCEHFFIAVEIHELCLLSCSHILRGKKRYRTLHIEAFLYRIKLIYKSFYDQLYDLFMFGLTRYFEISSIHLMFGASQAYRKNSFCPLNIIGKT